MDSRDLIIAEAAKAVEVLRRGGIILYPTDTVWGIGCDATRPDAVARVFEIKRRQEAKALITLVDSAERLERYVECVPEAARQLVEVAVDPMTIVYDHGCNLASNLLAQDGSVGIRVTSDPLCSVMIRELRRPIVSTSANISGEPAPRSFSEIPPEIVESVDYVVTLRRDETASSAPSMVIKISDSGVFKILRK